MSFSQELASWFSPPPVEMSPSPEIGSKAPSTEKLEIPNDDGKPIIITFLRHCGCPFAEATFANLRSVASSHLDIHCIAISHSSPSHTEKWVQEVGGADKVAVIVDSERKIYAKWGLGTSSWAHVLSPAGLYSAVTMGREKGIWNRPTESGSRWQAGGSFAVNGQGIVKWGGPSRRADEVHDFEDAVQAVILPE